MAYAIFETTSGKYINKYGSKCDIDDVRTFSRPENAKASIRIMSKYYGHRYINEAFEVHEVKIIRVK